MSQNPPLRLSRRLLAPAMLSAAAGCSLLFPGPAPHLYRLTAVAGFPPDLPHVAAQLLVAPPQASAGLDTRRIALVRSATSLDYFAHSEWADRLPRLVQEVLVDSFENSRAILAIGSDSAGLQADFILRSEIRHFEAVYGTPQGAPVVRAAIVVRLVRMPEGKIVHDSLVAARQPARVNKVPDIVAAFDAALGKVAERIVLETLADPALSGTGRRGKKAARAS